MAQWKGEAAIHIGGKDRVLRLDHNGLADLEELLGNVSLPQVISRGGLGVSLVRAAIAIGLREQVTRSPRQIGEWMSEEPERFAEYASAVVKAIALALHGPKLARELEKAEHAEDAPAPEVAIDERPPSSTGVSG